MKKLTKGIFYYKPKPVIDKNGGFNRAKTRQKYLDQNLPGDKLDEYLNDSLVMVWHECEKWSRRPGVNRVSMKCLKTTEDISYYRCAHCDFEYELDNHLALIESKG